MAEEQKKIEGMVLELNQLQANADVLRTNVEAVEAQINQITITGVTLDGITKAEEGQDILLPIGSNSFVFATLQNVQKVILGIGSDAAIETSIEKAQEKLAERLQELRGISTTLQNQLRTSLQRIEELRATVQEIYNKMQQR
ncbi:MAG: prefoldin subunit alpha [Candidatus Sifarchaeia archaeon]|jgi:prefoldin alpha subunit